MTQINILPDWYPAEIHQRRLTLAEWAEELNARTFVFELLKDPRITLEALSKEFISFQFTNFVIEGYRDEHNITPQTPPLFFIPPYKKTDEGQWSYNFTSKQFGRGLTFPLMVNIDYDSTLLKAEFESWLDHTKKLIDSGEYQKSLFGLMFDGEQFVNKFKLSKQSRGKKPYTENQTYDWFRYKVLDWIDLKLWGIVMNVEYEPTFLENLFCSGNSEGSRTNLNKTTIPWAYELLNRLTYDQITASCNKPSHNNFRIE